MFFSSTQSKRACKEIQSDRRNIFSHRVSFGRGLCALLRLSQLMFFRLKQSFLHESEGLSASPGSNICLWHIEVELRKGNKKCKTYFSCGAWDRTSKCGGGGRKVERDPFFAGGPAGSHNFDMRSGVRSAVMALIPCLMVGVSTLKGQSLCVSLETPSHRVKL